MRILVLDPGISTGWCVVKIDGTELSVESAGTIDPHDLIFQLLHWREEGFDEVIWEYVLTLSNSVLNNRLNAVHTKLVSAFPHATTIRPGHWKPVTGDSPVPNVGSKHTKDALRLALYWARLHVSPYVHYALDVVPRGTLP